MSTHHIIVELDDQTLASLATLGEPVEVLARLAHSAVDAVPNPHEKMRTLTDASLRSEREQADADPREGGASLSNQRRTTDEDLTGERARVDTVLGDQREANEQMVTSSLRAHNVALELRAVAELRELFIGILGHDLRNPLSSIVLAAGALMQRGHLDQQDVETTARIVRATQRITRMITQLLDLTRARLGGGLAIERKPADLRDICRNVVGEFDAPIQLDVDGDMKGNWDADRLAEVLSNLVGNAVEYHALETLVIVKARADGPYVIVEVTNEGTPIPADVLPSIFEPFRRVKSEEKSKTGNLGLGLYIAKQIVLSHGGTLDVRSAENTTTFTMRLPRVAP